MATHRARQHRPRPTKAPKAPRDPPVLGVMRRIEILITGANPSPVDGMHSRSVTDPGAAPAL